MKKIYSKVFKIECLIKRLVFLFIKHFNLATDFTTSLDTVAAFAAACPLTATTYATADATQNHQQNKRRNSNDEQIPPNVIHSDKCLLPEGVFLASDFECDSK